MAFKNGGVHVEEYVYDFAKDGGAVGFIDLSAKMGANPLPQECVALRVGYKVVTAPLSGGAATVAIGDAASGTRYLGATAIASLPLDAVAVASSGLPLNVDTVNEGRFGITIGTAALTAGKIVFWVEHVQSALE